mgnify:CR=1 FL=1
MNSQDISAILTKVDAMHPYKVQGDYDTYSQYNEGWCDAVSEIESRLVDTISSTTSAPDFWHREAVRLMATLGEQKIEAKKDIL